MSYTLRLVVNGYCNLRCFFCYQEGTAYSKATPVDYRQFVSLARDFAALRPLGKVRVTGGEPLAYPDLLPLLREMRAAFPSLDLGLTTNASMPGRLLQVAEAFRDDPLRISVSLPTLRAGAFAAITGSSRFGEVMASIEGLIARGLGPRVSINYVYLPNVNDGELPRMLRFARARGLRLKVICPVDNRFNHEQLQAFGVGSWLEERIADEIVGEGYEPNGTGQSYVWGGHRVELVDCLEQQPVPYFRKFRTLRIYYDGRAGISGDHDGYIRPLDLGHPRETLAAILGDIEGACWPGGAGRDTVEQPFAQPEAIACEL